MRDSFRFKIHPNQAPTLSALVASTAGGRSRCIIPIVLAWFMFDKGESLSDTHGKPSWSPRGWRRSRDVPSSPRSGDRAVSTSFIARRWGQARSQDRTVHVRQSIQATCAAPCVRPARPWTPQDHTAPYAKEGERPSSRDRFWAVSERTAPVWHLPCRQRGKQRGKAAVRSNHCENKSGPCER